MVDSPPWIDRQAARVPARSARRSAAGAAAVPAAAAAAARLLVYCQCTRLPARVHGARPHEEIRPRHHEGTELEGTEADVLPRGMARSGSSRACLGFGLPGGRTAVGVAMPVAGAAPARCTPPDGTDGGGEG